VSPGDDEGRPAGGDLIVEQTTTTVLPPVDRLSLAEADRLLAAALARCRTDAEVAAILAPLDALDRADAERLNAADLLARSAKWYAARGWPVFPVVPGGKRPATRHGLHDATTDVAAVASHWARHPTHNIGLPTGHAFDVIDIDGPPGFASLAEMRDAGVLPPLLGKVWTPRGGRHLYIAPTGDGNAAGIWPGIDYRGRGGYVVAPPSVGANGKRYAWLDRPSVLTS
jgi:hypothetical protein